MASCSFRAWNLLFQAFVAFTVWDEKSTDIRIGFPLCVIWCFSLVAFKILSYFDSCICSFRCLPQWSCIACICCLIFCFMDHFNYADSKLFFCHFYCRSVIEFYQNSILVSYCFYIFPSSNEVQRYWSSPLAGLLWPCSFPLPLLWRGDQYE